MCRRESRVVRKHSVILHSRSRARRDRCGISLAPDALAEPSPRKSDERAHAFTAFDSPSMEKSFHEDVAGSFGSSRDLRRGARVGTLCRWSSRESTRRIPGDSFGSCAISLRSRGRKDITVRRRNSGGHGRGTLTRHETRSSAFCGRRPRGDSPPGAIAASVGERRRAHAPDLIFVGIFDLFVRRVRLELGVGHVACRYVATVARIWKARVLMERGFVSRRVARFEAAQASLWARSGCPVTCV